MPLERDGQRNTFEHSDVNEQALVMQERGMMLCATADGLSEVSWVAHKDASIVLERSHAIFLPFSAGEDTVCYHNRIIDFPTTQTPLRDITANIYPACSHQSKKWYSIRADESSFQEGIDCV